MMPQVPWSETYVRLASTAPTIWFTRWTVLTVSSRVSLASPGATRARWVNSAMRLLPSNQSTAFLDLSAQVDKRDSHCVRPAPISTQLTLIAPFAQPPTIAAQTWLLITAQPAIFVRKPTTQLNQTHQAKSAQLVTTVQKATTGLCTVHLKLRVWSQQPNKSTSVQVASPATFVLKDITQPLNALWVTTVHQSATVCCTLNESMNVNSVRGTRRPNNFTNTIATTALPVTTATRPP